MNRFMARDYVTLRKEEIEGETVWTESSVPVMLAVRAAAIRPSPFFLLKRTIWRKRCLICLARCAGS